MLSGRIGTDTSDCSISITTLTSEKLSLKLFSHFIYKYLSILCSNCHHKIFVSFLNSQSSIFVKYNVFKLDLVKACWIDIFTQPDYFSYLSSVTSHENIWKTINPCEILIRHLLSCCKLSRAHWIFPSLIII